MTPAKKSTEAPARSAPAQQDAQLVPLIAGWLVVGVPAAWGVAQVVQKSLALFR
jgi:hypothetical protein